MNVHPIDALFVAPHLDDVVYSCGGTVKSLCDAGQNVLIVTIFAGLSPTDNLSSFAQEFHNRWAAASPTSENITTLRRSEDKQACTFLGANFLHLDFLDCIYRKDGVSWPYNSEESLFGSVHSADDALRIEVKETLLSLPGITTETKVCGPLSVGNHVDHQLVHAVVAEAFTNGHMLSFYEDYPYAADTAALTGSTDQEDWQSYDHPISAETLLAKQKAISMYASQFSTFWDSQETLAKELKKNWQERNQSERLWLLQR